MGRLALLKQAAAEKGISGWELYNGAKSGKYPAMRLGGPRGRWAFDLDLLDARIKELMEQNMKQEPQSTAEYGKLRRINV